MTLSLKTQLFAEDAEEAEIYADLFEDYDLDFCLSLKKYLKAVDPLTQRMRACIEDIYRKAGLSVGETGHVLVVGGMAITGGMLSMLTLMLKGLFCLMASFLLMATTPIDMLCAELRKLHVPKMLDTLLLLTYRYVGVMTEELAVMTEAYHLRAPGQKGIHISAWGSFLGQLLLRSMDRAQELYAAMLLRGYHQHFHYVDIRPFQKRDALYMLGSILFCLALRYVHVAQLLGGTIVR